MFNSAELCSSIPLGRSIQGAMSLRLLINATLPQWLPIDNYSLSRCSLCGYFEWARVTGMRARRATRTAASRSTSALRQPLLPTTAWHPRPSTQHPLGMPPYPRSTQTGRLGTGHTVRGAILRAPMPRAPTPRCTQVPRLPRWGLTPGGLRWGCRRMAGPAAG